MRSLLYPLGFIASLFFAARFFIQWIQSEKRKESVVSSPFWHLSWIGNLMMCLHGLIQLQYPICISQTVNACIAWRNLNLMGKKILSLKTVIGVMVFLCSIVTLLFILQANGDWMRPPTLPWSGKHASYASLGWHLIGFVGILLFSSRYWIQWWLAEKQRRSFLGKSFWWTSCIGALFSLTYAIRLSDPVNILGFGLGLIPYIRNLVLLKKKKEPPVLPSSTPSLFLFAGEQSGDLIGGQLVEALKKELPHLPLYGVGGSQMQQAGMTLLHPMERFQVMGFTQALTALPRLYRDFKKIEREILEKQPTGVILIDYPDFNMRLAKALRSHGYPGKIIHYVSPSVWAWRKKRVYSLAKTLDHLLTILPFEKECYSKTPLPVTYVGHPLVAAIDHHPYSPTIHFPKPLIAIFPGSRPQEIELNLPIQLQAAQKMGSAYTIAVSQARPQLSHLLQKYLSKDMIVVPAEKRYELMKEATVALATSGTIILELGLHGVPTVATYRVSPFNGLIGKYFCRINLPFYTLVNIICQKEVYPEFVHAFLSQEKIYAALKNMLNHSDSCRSECLRLRHLLSPQNASLKAAQTISQVIGVQREVPLS
jgi:lipid-A-disaccharide synthase